MASKKKKDITAQPEQIPEELTTETNGQPVIEEKKDEIITQPEEKVEKIEGETTERPVIEEKKAKKEKKGPKYPVGSIVYISKDTLADLNGFNLSISQYKRDTYTVEAYDENTGIYKLRHLKLLLNLKEADLVSPDENAHDSVHRRQF